MSEPLRCLDLGPRGAQQDHRPLPEISVTCDLVREFVGMLWHRCGSHLEAWTKKVTSGSYAASPPDCARPGPRMHGRPKPDLLRKRVLLPD